MSFYLRTENNKIEFLTNEIHEIKNTDMLLLDEEYNKFFELQSKGKQFKLKEAVTFTLTPSLFDYVEEFVNEPNATEEVITLESLKSEIEALKTEIETMKASIN